MDTMLVDSRPCKSCEGSGTYFSPAFTYGDHSYPDEARPCSSCKGVGHFDPIDVAAIRKEIFSSRGKHGLKASLNSYKASHRGYYVWRMARFHGGADMTMPVMAGVWTHSDPFIADLDALADVVAREAFGSDLKAALRWGRALGAI